MLLIEDFAHSLPIQHMSRDSSRLQNCDIAIFSLKKQLPLPDGGFAIYKSSLAINTEPVKRLPPAVSGRQLCVAVEQRLLSRTLDLRRLFVKADPSAQENHLQSIALIDFDEVPPVDQMPAQYSLLGRASKWRPSNTAMRFWRDCDLHAIAERRRRNAAFVRNGLAAVSGVEFPLAEPGARACLWALPFLWERVPECDRRLRAAGVPVFTFARPLHPAVEGVLFPAARRWSRQLKLLPIHQDLTIEDLQQLPALFSQIAERH
jgi:hypothetical protein